MDKNMHYDAQDLRAIESTGRLDANEAIHFARQLEFVKSQAYDVKRPALSAMALFPVDTSVPAGASTVTYRQYDAVGMAKVIANYADDLPRADVTAKEFTSPVRGVGISYGYSVQEIRASAFAGTSLDSKKMRAAQRGHEMTINQLAWSGDTAAGIPGFLTNANIPAYTVPADGTSSSKLWSAKTPDLILRDMNGIVNSVYTVTKGVHKPNELWIPQAQYALISSTARSSTSDTTILEFFLNANPFIERVIPVVELTGAGAGGTDLMVAAENMADNYQLVIPMAFMQHAPQQVNLEFTVPCESRCGGVIIEYPLAFAIGSGI